MIKNYFIKKIFHRFIKFAIRTKFNSILRNLNPNLTQI